MTLRLGARGESGVSLGLEGSGGWGLLCLIAMALALRDLSRGNWRSSRSGREREIEMHCKDETLAELAWRLSESEILATLISLFKTQTKLSAQTFFGSPNSPSLPYTFP